MRIKIANWLTGSDLLEAGEGSGSSNAQISQANLKNFTIKAVGISGNGTTTEYQSAEHDLAEIKDATDTDSYLRVSVLKYAQLITKNGFKMTSVNENALSYLQSRIRLMEFGTNIPFSVLIQGIAYDLAEYSNAFIVKSRVDSIQGGVQATGILDTKPVGGWFRIDPSTVQIKRDSAGTIQGYQQDVDGTTKTFKTTDIVHFYMDKDAGNAFGTPRISVALDDVKILRKIEGHVLSLIYRFAIPLYQVKIGIPEQNMMATDQEIKEAQKEIENMPSDGIIVTNERTEFNSIGAEGEAINLQPYLSYFENRVFSALNLSQSMMGRGGAKQDADSMEQQVHDQVKYFQTTIEAFIEVGMFNEILLEGGFNPISTPDDSVRLTFNEISLDTKVKMENNVLTKYQGNLIEFGEARRELGLTADGVDVSQLYSNLITQTNERELLQMKLGATTTTTAGGDNRTLNGKQTSQTPNKDAKNKNMPTNQYGTFSAKVKEMRESVNTEQEYRENYGDIYKKYSRLRNKIGERTGITRDIYDTYWDSIQQMLKQYAADAAGRGALQYDISYHIREEYQPFEIPQIESLIERTISALADEMYKKIKQKKDPVYRRSVADTMAYRIRFTVTYIVQKSYWYGYALEAKRCGVKTLSVRFHSEKDETNHKKYVSLSRISLFAIPPFHPYCKCSLFKEGDM